MKLEPLSPEQAGTSDDDQSMELEPLSHVKAEHSENDHPRNIEYLSVEKTVSDGDQLMKLGLEEVKQSKEYSVYSEGSSDLDHQSKKPKAISCHSAKDDNDDGDHDDDDADKTQSIGEIYSSDMYPDQPKYFVPQNWEGGSLYKFKLTVPHYVEQDVLAPLIQVKWGNIHEKLLEICKGKPEDKLERYCEVYQDHVVVYSTHFCDVVCTLPQKVCASKLLGFPFGQIDSKPGRKETYTKMKTYLCNHLYQDESLRKVGILYNLVCLMFSLFSF